jgi:hypothetical protein
VKQEKKKRKIRFFNRPVKIGIGFAGLSGSLELGSQSVYELIQEPNLVFWLEIAKYVCMALSIIFGVFGVGKQSVEDSKTRKVGEKVKEIVKEVAELEEKPEDTFLKEETLKQEGLKKAFDIARDFFKNRIK